MKHVVARALSALVLLTVLVGVGGPQATATHNPNDQPDCRPDGPGFSNAFGDFNRQVDPDVFLREGLTSVGIQCFVDDAGLPPIFPKSHLTLAGTWSGAADSAATWAGLVSRSPKILVAADTMVLADQRPGEWRCPLVAPGEFDPRDCGWIERIDVRVAPCAIVGVVIRISGADAVLEATSRLAPSIDYAGIAKAITSVIEKNASAAGVGSLRGGGCIPTCTASGSVVGHLGQPIPHLTINVINDTNNNVVLGNGYTETDGTFSVEFACQENTRFARNTDRVRVEVQLLDGQNNQFEVYYRDQPSKLHSDRILLAKDQTDIVRSFDARNIRPAYGAPNVPKSSWGTWLQIFAWAHDANKLPRLMGDDWNDPKLPLEIYASCSVPACQRDEYADGDFAFFNSEGVRGPYIALGARYARLDNPRLRSAIDHEMGHAWHHDGYDLGSEGIPGRSPNHGGYANPNSDDALTEGFAAFFALMVARDVRGIESFQFLNGFDLEAGIKPWDDFRSADGAQWISEELAAASVMLDLVDGPNDYPTRTPIPDVVVSGTLLRGSPNDLRRTYLGSVVNFSSTTVRGVKIAISARDAAERELGTQVVAISPSVLDPDEVGRFVAVLPYAGIAAVDEIVHTGTSYGNGDPDRVTGTLSEFWRAMRDYRSNNNRLRYMSELHGVMKDTFGGDQNGDLMDDVDEIFVEHGFFTTRDGNHEFDAASDTVGRTDRSPGEVRLTLDEVGPGHQVMVTGSLGASLAIQIIAPPGADHLARGFIVTPDANGAIALPLAPASLGAEILVTAMHRDGRFDLVDHLNPGDVEQRLSVGRRVTRRAELMAPDDPADEFAGLGEDIPAPNDPQPTGYRMLEANGEVHVFGEATDLGDINGRVNPGETAVAMAVTPSSLGYIILTSDGWTGSKGDAPRPDEPRPIDYRQGERPATIAITPSAAGFWIFTNQGRVIEFGDAPHLGDLLDLSLAGKIVASIATPTGNGYYLLGSDGGVFAFGDANFYGSVPEVLPGVQLACPVVGLVPTPDNRGYWLVACDGGVFAFGSAQFAGSIPQVLPGVALNSRVNGMVAYGGGYLMVAGDGGAFNFGAPFFGSLGATRLNSDIVAINTFLS